MSDQPAFDMEAYQAAFVKHLAAMAGIREGATRRPPTIPVVLWKAGHCISEPSAAVVDPPPPHLTVRCHRLRFASLDEVVDYLTGEPETEEYVLQYVKPEPRIAVYLYAPEALALLESA